MILIPQANPHASYLALKEAIDNAIQRVLDSGWYIHGSETQAFENEFTVWHQLGDSIGVGNGTDAIELALRTIDVGDGAEVITSAHTATASISAIELAGATPVLVDVDLDTYTLNPNQIESVITSRTKAIMPIHLYGMPAPMDAILTVAQKHSLAVIEDCAQAHGARFNGKLVGTWGVLSAFSFYPTKNLGAFGDGGLVGVTDPSLSSRARSLAQYGWRQRFVSEVAGMNSRLDEIQAAILRCKLKLLERNNERRQAIAQRYSSAFGGLSSALIPPQVPNDRRSVFHLYVIRHPNRDALHIYLEEHGIGSAIQYPVPIHLQPAYQGKLGDIGSFPVAERVTEEVLSLPLYPEMTDQQVDTVIEAILTWPEL